MDKKYTLKKENERTLKVIVNEYEKRDKKRKHHDSEKVKTKEPISLSLILISIGSFLFPPLGYIFYMVWKNRKPKDSQRCGWCSLIGCIFYIILAIVLVLVLKPGIKTA